MNKLRSCDKSKIYKTQVVNIINNDLLIFFVFFFLVIFRSIGELDPNSSDHVVATTQLKETIASLQKKVQQKDNELLSKDKLVCIINFLLLHLFTSWVPLFHSYKFRENFQISTQSIQ